MQDAIGVVDPLEIVIDLGAERAAGERMRRGAVQLPGGTVVHFYYPTARVRTVVPTCAANDLDRAGRAHRAMIPSNLERPIMNPVQALMRLAPVTSRLDKTDMASVSGMLASARQIIPYQAAPLGTTGLSLSLE